MVSYLGQRDDEYRAEETTKDVVEAPLGEDIHQAINEIAEIDQQILRLQKRRVSSQDRIDMYVREIQKHYQDVIDPPEKSEGYETPRIEHVRGFNGG